MSRSARERTKETAVVADSCMTLRMLPVSVMLPLPGILRRFDEEDLAAGRRPREAGGDARLDRAARRISGRYLCGAEHLLDELGRDLLAHVLALGERTATSRQTAAISRSRLRTPASLRVVVDERRRCRRSANSSRSSVRPCSESCLGTRNSRAMPSFSLRV